MKIGREKRKGDKDGTKAEKKTARDGKDGAKREQESQWHERQLAWAGAY